MVSIWDGYSASVAVSKAKLPHLEILPISTAEQQLWLSRLQRNGCRMYQASADWRSGFSANHRRRQRRYTLYEPRFVLALLIYLRRETPQEASHSAPFQPGLNPANNNVALPIPNESLQARNTKHRDSASVAFACDGG